MKCGIVGLPNVGKSTLFNAITKAGIDAENYPFCTIEPNIGIITVPDDRLDKISSLVNPQKVIPTTVEIVLVDEEESEEITIEGPLPAHKPRRLAFERLRSLSRSPGGR